MEKRKPRSYRKSFKMKVVQEILEGKYTKEEARRVYDIKANCAVLYWMHKFSADKNYRQSSEYKEGMIEMGNNIENRQLAERIKELEEELQREKQRADLWQKIVELAEEKLGISITKKFGARQYSELKNKEKRG